MIVLILIHTKICVLRGEPTSLVMEKSDFTILILLLQNSFDSKEMCFRFSCLKGIILYPKEISLISFLILVTLFSGRLFYVFHEQI